MTKTEVKEWLNHPLTKLFQEALQKECESSRQKMMDEIEGLHFNTAQDLQNRTIEYNAAIHVYKCFSDEDAANTIIELMNAHGLLEEEDDQNEATH